MAEETFQGDVPESHSIDASNVTTSERWLYWIAGGAAIVQGLRQRGWGGMALAFAGTGLVYMGITGRSPLYRALGFHLVETTGGPQRLVVRKTMTIGQPAHELYRFWRKLDTLPTIMTHLESVDVLDEKRSRWTVKGPAGSRVVWDAEIVNEDQDKLIAWQSCDGSQVDHWGVVRFAPAPGDRGTEVTIELEYEPLGGSFGAALARLFGENPEQQIEDDLRRYKQFMEAGEIPTIAGQPRGPDRLSLRRLGAGRTAAFVSSAAAESGRPLPAAGGAS